MDLKPPIIDDNTFQIIKNQLGLVSAKHGYKYISAEHLLGVMVEEHHELIHAIHDGKGKITTAVLSELIDIAVVCVKGVRSYMQNESQLCNLHGLREK